MSIKLSSSIVSLFTFGLALTSVHGCNIMAGIAKPGSASMCTDEVVGPVLRLMAECIHDELMAAGSNRRMLRGERAMEKQERNMQSCLDCEYWEQVLGNPFLCAALCSRRRGLETASTPKEETDETSGEERQLAAKLDVPPGWTEYTATNTCKVYVNIAFAETKCSNFVTAVYSNDCPALP